jgi:hypothetical protein
VSYGPRRPWVFPYVEEPVYRGHPPDQRSVLRPLLELTIVGDIDEAKVAALVDSGAENTLLGPWLPRAVGLNPDPSTEIVLGVGGGKRRVQFCDLTLRLSCPDEGAEPDVEWQAEVGVLVDAWEPPFPAVLGQLGFFDKFTVTLHRGVPAIVVEDWAAFDKRFET